jgi:hypothetical protein
LRYYGNLDAPIATKKHKKQWRELLACLQQLKAQPAVAAASTGDQYAPKFFFKNMHN